MGRRGLDTFYPRRACNSSKGCRMVNAWTKEALEHLQESTCCSTSSLTAAKSSIVLFFLQSASWIKLLLGGGPFIVLRSRGISQIATPTRRICTMVTTPRLRLGVTTVAEDIITGAYPPLRCGISYTYFLLIGST